tara:strand:+ start:1360 stop:2307 length:948 start_codon:yes stop_codon:yes gene_type:complete
MSNSKKSIKSETCKIYFDSDFVSWTIYRDKIQDTLLGKKGLLFLNVESAGEIEFKDSSCKINKKSERLCDKTMSSGLKYTNGSTDSVYTPLSVVNFHTHPLHCYIDAETIWGWPSGEDLAQCMNFANDNNLTHIIFAIEGTYVIDVNKFIINSLQTSKPLFKKIRRNIEEIFKLTHKHRMIYNDSNPDISLEHEFHEIFLSPLGFSSQQNILLSWLYLVNNLTLHNLFTLCNEFSKYFKDISKISLKELNDYDEKYLNINIFSIDFFRNGTIQWQTGLSKKEIFKYMSKHSKNLEINLPNKIQYKAPFISEKCKL